MLEPSDLLKSESNSSNEGWQPARFRVAHSTEGNAPYLSEVYLKELLTRVMYIRPVTPSLFILSEYAKVGCDATKFYECRPEDCRLSGGKRAGQIACEHEILTD
jgi:hypothetical protein